MKNYILKKGENLKDVAEKIGLQNPSLLREFHNQNCELKNLLGSEIKAGTSILIPPQPKIEDLNKQNSSSFLPTEKNIISSPEEKEKQQAKELTVKETPEQTQKNTSSHTEHEGKYFVIQKGKATCNKGSSFPQFKVSSHTKNYWNNEEGKADYLAVTEEDTQFTPTTSPFGNCSLKKNEPCAFSPAGKWQKCYEQVKILGKACVTEISELTCSVGGKITVKSNGQTQELSATEVRKANKKLHSVINPLVDIEDLDTIEFHVIS